MADVSNVFTLKKHITTGSAVTLLQTKSGPTGLYIVRIEVTQRASAAEQAILQLLMKTAAATVTAAIIGTTLHKHDRTSGAPNPTMVLDVDATGHTATVEGTDGEELWAQGFDIRIGALYRDSDDPLHPNGYYIPPDSVAALKFLAAPTTSRTWCCSLTVREG